MTTRITGGTHRGRRLRVPATAGLRPTSERVRSALFSVLGPDAVAGKRVADLYAGTGAIGLDALSRGAGWVDFVERNGRLCGALSARLREWSLSDRAKVYRASVLAALDTRIGGQLGGYDLVVADPPYRQAEAGELDALLERLQSARLVNPGGLVVLEHGASLWTGEGRPFPKGRYALETTRTYGDTAITVLSINPDGNTNGNSEHGGA